MAVKESIITGLRIGSAAAAKLDAEIERKIAYARAEMIRVGVDSAFAQSSHELVEEAIISYALAELGSQITYERYKDAWQYQLENLRKSPSVATSQQEEANV